VISNKHLCREINAFTFLHTFSYILINNIFKNNLNDTISAIFCLLIGQKSYYLENWINFENLPMFTDLLFASMYNVKQ